MQSLTLPLALAALLAAGHALADETWRCNSALVSVGDSTARVAHTCGEPPSKSATGYVHIPDNRGGYSEVPVQRWTYGPEAGMYHTLRFEGDRLAGITSERG